MWVISYVGLLQSVFCLIKMSCQGWITPCRGPCERNSHAWELNLSTSLPGDCMLTHEMWGSERAILCKMVACSQTTPVLHVRKFEGMYLRGRIRFERQSLQWNVLFPLFICKCESSIQLALEPKLPRIWHCNASNTLMVGNHCLGLSKISSGVAFPAKKDKGICYNILYL